MKDDWMCGNIEKRRLDREKTYISWEAEYDDRSFEVYSSMPSNFCESNPPWPG